MSGYAVDERDSIPCKARAHYREDWHKKESVCMHVSVHALTPTASSCSGINPTRTVSVSVCVDSLHASPLLLLVSTDMSFEQAVFSPPFYRSAL